MILSPACPKAFQQLTLARLDYSSKNPKQYRNLTVYDDPNNQEL